MCLYLSVDLDKLSEPNERADDELGNGGMATEAQKKYCNMLIEQLCEIDPKPNVEPIDRLLGAIRKAGGTNMCTKDEPFDRVTQENCSKLIEFLKRCVNTEKRKAKRRGDSSG